MRIQQEYCNKITDCLSDTNLLEEYKKCVSVQNETMKLKTILDHAIEDEVKKEQIINEYIFELIPAGTKGVIRGNQFNRIVKSIILAFPLLLSNSSRFEICFEKKCDKYITSEIPDWYIYDHLTSKVILGMNQLDLWSGGHQLNRGYKYLQRPVEQNCKLVCVVCNYIELKSIKNKIYQLFQMGYTHDTLCYVNGLERIIYSYFNLH